METNIDNFTEFVLKDKRIIHTKGNTTNKVMAVMPTVIAVFFFLLSMSSLLLFIFISEQRQINSCDDK